MPHEGKKKPSKRLQAQHKSRSEAEMILDAILDFLERRITQKALCAELTRAKQSHTIRHDLERLIGEKISDPDQAIKIRKTFNKLAA